MNWWKSGSLILAALVVSLWMTSGASACPQAFQDVNADACRTLSVNASGTVGSSAGTANANAPTLNEGGLYGFFMNLAGALRVTLDTCLSGESACIGTSPNSYIMTTGGVVRSFQLVGTGGIPSTATNTTTSAATLPTGNKTFLGTVTCTGTCTQTQAVYGDWNNDATSGVLLCTITLNAATTAIDTCPLVNANFNYYYVVTTNTGGSTPLSASFAMY